MEASRVTIQQQLLENHLSMKHKMKLRQNALKEYIRSKPSGFQFTKAELLLSAGYRANQQATGYAFIKRCLKLRIIAIDDEIPGPKSKQSYYIPGDSKTIEPPKQIKTENVETEEKDHYKITKIKVDTESIVEMAKKFSWEHNSDSLRDFIATLQ